MSIISIDFGAALAGRDGLLEGVEVDDDQVEGLDRSRPRSRAWSSRDSSASTPPKIFGWRVLTRPPRISGKPGLLLDERDRDARLFRCAAVPPVDTISTPREASARPNSAMPDLSYTEMSARRIGVTADGMGIGSAMRADYSRGRAGNTALPDRSGGAGRSRRP